MVYRACYLPKRIWFLGSAGPANHVCGESSVILGQHDAADVVTTEFADTFDGSESSKRLAGVHLPWRRNGFDARCAADVGSHITLPLGDRVHARIDRPSVQTNAETQITKALGMPVCTADLLAQIQRKH